MEADSKNYNGDQSAVILENENLNEQNSHSQSTSSGTNEYQSQSSSSTSATINDDANVDSSQQDTKLFLGGEWISIPSILTSDETIFRMVINEGSFHSLSQASKDHLKRFLPPSRGNSFESFLDSTFTNDKNFCFGNPLKKFFEKIKAGFFTAADHVQLRDHKRVLYDHYIRHYQMNLLKKLLINRHARLERASKVQASEIDSIRVSAKNCSSQKKLQKYTIVKRRARIRAKRMIDDCRKKSGQHSGISSDESSPEDDSSTLPIPQNARSTMFSEKFSADLDLYQPVRMKEVSELYQEYSYLRETEPDCPSLDISDITLEEIYERTGISFQTERNFSKINSSFEQQPTNIARFVSKRRQKEKSGEKRGDITGNETKSDLQSPPTDFHESN